MVSCSSGVEVSSLGLLDSRLDGGFLKSSGIMIPEFRSNDCFAQESRFLPIGRNLLALVLIWPDLRELFAGVQEGKSLSQIRQYGIFIPHPGRIGRTAELLADFLPFQFPEHAEVDEFMVPGRDLGQGGL